MRWTILLLALAACGDDSEEPTPDASAPIDASSPIDTSVPDAAVDAGPTLPDCFSNPTTYLELINACTDAEKVTKNPVLPLLGADGKLPPLP